MIQKEIFPTSHNLKTMWYRTAEYEKNEICARCQEYIPEEITYNEYTDEFLCFNCNHDAEREYDDHMEFLNHLENQKSQNREPEYEDIPSSNSSWRGFL